MKLRSRYGGELSKHGRLAVWKSPRATLPIQHDNSKKAKCEIVDR